MLPNISIYKAPKPPIQSPVLSSMASPNSSVDRLAENLFPEDTDAAQTVPSTEETLIRIPGAILHLIDAQQSLELASGELSISRICQGDNTVVAFVRVGGVRWPLARDEAAVKLDASHYFFSLHLPDSDADAGTVNYGLTFATKGQDDLLKELDEILELYSGFSIKKVEAEELDASLEREVAPEELEVRSAAYWTALAPNVEDYSGSLARGIAMGSGQLVKGILWCGEVTADRIKWGNDVAKRRMKLGSKEAQVSPEALRRIQRVKRLTKMSEEVMNGVLSGVVRVSGFFTSPIFNSKAGRKFFSLLPGEIVLASLDGFGKICDAVEVAGKNVLQTSSTVTSELVSHRYGKQAAEVTNEGLGAAGHAFGTAWAVFKIRKAMNPKNVMKPSALAKSAAKSAAADFKVKHVK